MSDTLAFVIALAGRVSGLPVERIGSNASLWHDLRISGDDLEDFASAIAERFGRHVFGWPWQRFTDLNEPSLLTIADLFWRWSVALVRREWPRPTPRERLEMAHIARVLDTGHWVEP